MAMSKEKKNKITWIIVILSLLANAYVGFGFVLGWEHMLWVLAICSILFGPVCLIFYLIELKRGVFNYIEDEEESTIDKPIE